MVDSLLRCACQNMFIVTFNKCFKKFYFSVNAKTLLKYMNMKCMLTDIISISSLLSWKESTKRFLIDHFGPCFKILAKVLYKQPTSYCYLLSLKVAHCQRGLQITVLTLMMMIIMDIEQLPIPYCYHLLLKVAHCQKGSQKTLLMLMVIVMINKE